MVYNNNYFFGYEECEDLYEIVEHYKNKIGRRRVHKVLIDNCVIFESLNYGKDSEGNHEDLIDAGYVLGRVQGQNGGIILAINFESFRYFYVGTDGEICRHLKYMLKKECENGQLKPITMNK